MIFTVIYVILLLFFAFLMDNMRKRILHEIDARIEANAPPIPLLYEAGLIMLGFGLFSFILVLVTSF